MTATTPEAMLPGRRLTRRAIASAAVASIALILVVLLVVLDSSSSSTTADPTSVPAVVDGAPYAPQGPTSADAAERHALVTADRCIEGPRSPDAIERCLSTSGPAATDRAGG